MAPLVKSLLHKQKRLKFNPKQSCKRLALRAQPCNPGSSEAWTGEFLGLTGPSSRRERGEGEGRRKGRGGRGVERGEERGREREERGREKGEGKGDIFL